MILLLLLFIAMALGESDYCSSNTITQEGANNYTVVMAPDGGQANVTLIFNTTGVAPQTIDIYFLWETSYDARSLGSLYWQSGPKRLLLSLLPLHNANPNIAFGLGFYTTKRLAGIGTYRSSDTFHTDYVFMPVVPVGGSIFSIDANMVHNQWAAYDSVSNVSSSLEALMHVILTGTSSSSIRFRAGSRRVLVLVANKQTGVEGDAPARVIFIANTIPFPPPNNNDGIISSSCVVQGDMCPDSCGVVVSLGNPNVLPDAYCGGCGLMPGTLSALNWTQFAAGSCEDFPSVAGFIGAAATAPLFATPAGVDFIAFLPNAMDFSAGRNDALYTLVGESLPFHAWTVATNTINLAPFLSPYAPIIPSVASTALALQGAPSDLAGYTQVSCNFTMCVYVLTFNYVDGGDGPVGATFSWHSQTGNVTVINCRRSRSESRSHSHKSDSRSRSHESESRSHSHKSDSHSRSHESDSHTKSHESDSHSRSHESDSHSKSHDSKSHSDSHKSRSHESKSHSRSKESRSRSHESESRSKSHKSDSHSHSHHSDSHSRSKHSKSHSPSHHSHSHSASHKTKSHSPSHHSHSHSASHETKSHSRSKESRSRSRESISKSHASVSHASKSASHKSHSRSHHSLSVSSTPIHRRGNRTGESTQTQVITVAVVVPVMVLFALIWCCCAFWPLGIRRRRMIWDKKRQKWVHVGETDI